MTVSSEVNKVAYIGDGTNNALSTVFPFIDTADLIVTQRVTATGVETTLVEGTHYTVSGGNYAVGDVTPVDGATDFPSTVTWTITRDTPKSQLTDYVEEDDFGAETHEKALDKTTMIAIDAAGKVDRAIKVAISDDAPQALPTATERASKYLAFDASGDPIAALTAPSDVVVSAFGETLIDDANAAAARATLDAQQTLSATYVTDNQKLPRGHLQGLKISWVSGAVFQAGVGACRCGTSGDQDLVDGVHTTGSFTKGFISGGWVSGSAAGGVPTALSPLAAAVDTWHFFMLVKQDGSVVDFGFDTSLFAVNLIADDDVITALGASCYFRRLGSFVCDGTPEFADFTQIGDEFLLNTPVLDYDDVTEDISGGITVTLASVPNGIRVKALLRVSHDGANNDPLQIRPSVEADVASTHTAAPLGAYMGNHAASVHGGGDLEIWTGTSQDIYMRKVAATSDTYIVTRGWIDRRGRDD
jgi:hypothetical protein